MPTTPSRKRIDAFLRFIWTGSFGPVRKNPCGECPWRRKSVRGWLGPHTPESMIDMAHGDGPVWCHTSIPDGAPPYEDYHVPEKNSPLMQCGGAARFRRHVHKVPKNPSAAVGPEDRDRVFTSNSEFLEHHVPVRVRGRR